MVKMSYDVVKRWVNEAQEAASSDNIMVQVGLSFNKCTLCQSLWIKSSVKCPKCKREN